MIPTPDPRSCPGQRRLLLWEVWGPFPSGDQASRRGSLAGAPPTVRISALGLVLEACGVSRPRPVPVGKGGSFGRGCWVLGIEGGEGLEITPLWWPLSGGWEGAQDGPAGKWPCCSVSN